MQHQQEQHLESDQYGVDRVYRVLGLWTKCFELLTARYVNSPFDSGYANIPRGLLKVVILHPNLQGLCTAPQQQFAHQLQHDFLFRH